MKTPISLAAFFALLLAASTAGAQVWYSASPVVVYDTYRPTYVAPSASWSYPTTTYYAGPTYSTSAVSYYAGYPTYTPTYSTYYPTTYSTYYPSTYSTYYAPSYTAYSAPVTYSPVVYSAWPAAVSGTSVYGTPTVYYSGQPVRNALRSVLP